MFYELGILFLKIYIFFQWETQKLATLLRKILCLSNQQNFMNLPILSKLKKSFELAINHHTHRWFRLSFHHSQQRFSTFIS